MEGASRHRGRPPRRALWPRRHSLPRGEGRGRPRGRGRETPTPQSWISRAGGGPPLLPLGMRYSRGPRVSCGDSEEQSIGLVKERHEPPPRRRGEGLRRLVLVASSILFLPWGSLVTIEEPEAGLDPTFQARMAELLRILARTAGANVLAETRSADFVTALDPKSGDGELRVMGTPAGCRNTITEPPFGVGWKAWPIHVKERPGTVFLLAANIVGGSSAIMIKASTIHPVLQASYRVLFAGIILAPLFFRELRRSGRRLSLRLIAPSVLPGIVLGLHFITWIFGARMTLAGNATVIVTMVPVAMPFFVFFMIRELPRRAEIVGTISRSAASRSSRPSISARPRPFRRRPHLLRFNAFIRILSRAGASLRA